MASQHATAKDYELAEELFQRAIDLDPHFTDAYCGLVTVRIRGAVDFQSRDLKDIQSSTERLARFAVTLEADNPLAHSCLSNALFARGDFDGALVEAERALALSPNLAAGYWRKSHALMYLGRPKEALEDLQTSLRLERRGATLAVRLTQVVVALYYSRAYGDAVAAAMHAIRSFPEFPRTYRVLAAALGQLGRADEAKAALETAIAIAPASFDLFVSHRVPWHRPEDHAHMLEGLRKAGWREE